MSERGEGVPQGTPRNTTRVDAATHPLAAVADIVLLGTPTGTLDLPETVTTLGAMGLRNLLCEGGPRFFGALTAADLVDELCLTIAPLLAGPGAGRITEGDEALPVPMRLAHLLQADDATILRYVRR